MSQFVLTETTIAKVHQAMADGTLTCEALVKAYLDRIEALDRQGPCLNAVIAVNPAALDTARQLDLAYATGGLTGPLHGVPVLLKDNCETMNMPTTAGSLSLEGWVSGRDAWIVRLLREAGAVILAKTNLHEFAVWGETVSSVLGQTLNPYDHTRTPGGSSGGTGAGIAANFGLIGIGTDTINSIRSPSSACSLCGIRPTLGMVSRSGIVPYSMTQDTAGPICRTLEDAVRTLDVLAGSDPDDPATAIAHEKAPTSYLDFLKADGLKGKRLGILASFLGSAEENMEVNDVFAAALECFRQAGAEVIDVTDPIDSGYLVREVSVHLHELKTHLGGYLAAFGNRVPVHSIDEILASGRYTPDIEDNLRTANLLGVGVADYDQRLERRAALQKQTLDLMDRYGLDALLYPHQQQLVCKVGSSQQQRNGVLGSVTGFPAIVVPGGFTCPTKDAPIGVPVGLELLGRPFGEGCLIEIGYGFEQASHLRRPPALD